jgi:hypothetical protein
MEHEPIVLPEKQPYEGRATQKQKQKLWDLGYREQQVIDRSGKRQASILIEQLLFPTKTPENFHRIGIKRLALGGLIGFVGLIVFSFASGLTTASFGSYLGIIGIAGGFLISISGIDNLIKSKN